MEKQKSLATNFDLWLLMQDVVHALALNRQRELTPYNVGHRQLWVLYAKYKLGSKATIPEIAKKLDRKFSVISRQTANLEKEGLIQRTKKIPKSHLLTIELTEHGLDLLKISKESKSIDEMLSFLNEEERQQLNLILNRILINLKEHSNKLSRPGGY